jgi:hypothetical protein
MKMQMVNNLPCRPAVIAKNVVVICTHSRNNRTGNFPQPSRNLSQKFGGATMHLLKVLTRHHEGMTIANRPDIEKRNDNVVLVNLQSGYLSGRYFAKNAVLCTHSPGPSPSSYGKITGQRRRF